MTVKLPLDRRRTTVNCQLATADQSRAWFVYAKGFLAVGLKGKGDNMAKQSGLGKGLKALIPEIITQPDGITELPVAEIMPDAKQPRRHRDADKLSMLTASVKVHGVLSPILVRRAPDGYIIIAGERRWTAAKAAGLITIPAVVRDVSPSEVLQLALIENLQREDLNAIDTALGYKRLREEYGMTHERIAESVGVSRAAVTNTLRLLQLGEDVQQLLQLGDISESHARLLLMIEDVDTQREVALLCADNKWSVRQLEGYIKQLSQQPKEKKQSPLIDEKFRAHIGSIEREIEQSIGLPARIMASDNNKGRIVLTYNNQEEFERFYSLIGGEQS